jgi:hypothetical protein
MKSSYFDSVSPRLREREKKIVNAEAAKDAEQAQRKKVSEE